MTEKTTPTDFIKPWRAQFSRLPDGGLLFYLPNEVADAIGWDEGDLLDADVDKNGQIIVRKIDTAAGAETQS
ncbi:AbrB/MazE/SpoVT family DNA-binding domain-containing protein [Asticcacaulis excentricus]|uniref:AbrB/MazE/SpoVT family DNA-binding domain-containing protein n=1 Tax=Asticcacaulis excentricus TaxID=78587 RepID=UPI000F84E211|nr:AbrB/MazE/SpoVT family DNA-binding domain-containing protein [Asticcacaulis excentricus]